MADADVSFLISTIGGCQYEFSENCSLTWYTITMSGGEHYSTQDIDIFSQNIVEIKNGVVLLSDTKSSISDISSCQPLISIIIAVKNNVGTIKRAVESVISQSYCNIELIVVDGASTDGTTEVLQNYLNKIDHYLSEVDDGVYSAWNKSLKMASGDWVCFLGSDDFFCDTSSIEKMVQTIIRISSENIAVVYGQLNFVDSSELIIRTIGIAWEIAQQSFCTYMTVPYTGTLIKRSLFDEMGKFDESFRIAGDYEFFLRVFERYDALFIPNVVQASMKVGGLSNNLDNFRLVFDEANKAKQLHPQNRFKKGKLYVISLIKLKYYIIILYIFENFPKSFFNILFPRFKNNLIGNCRTAR